MYNTGYNELNYLTCPKGLEEVVWENWSAKQVCADCERELGDGMGKLSLG